MYVIGKEKSLPRPVVPALVGRKHVVSAPEADVARENGLLFLRIVEQHARAHEDGVCEHVHLVLEGKGLGGGVVVAGAALYELAVLVAHRGAAGKDGNAVFGVVVEVAGAEEVALLVLQLHKGAAELRQVAVYQVVKLICGKDGLVLDDLYVPHAVDNLVVYVPERGIAYEIGAVMQEGRGNRFAELLAVLLELLYVIGLHQAHIVVVLLAFGAGGDAQRDYGNKRKEQFQSFANLLFHPSSSNSQSWNSGSILMYVTSILSLMNLSIASACLALRTSPSSSV